MVCMAPFLLPVSRTTLNPRARIGVQGLRAAPSRESKHEAELNDPSVLAVLDLVTITSILAAFGYSTPGCRRRRQDYLKTGELLAPISVDDASRTRVRAQQLMSCTEFFAPHKSLKSANFNKMCGARPRRLRRFSLEQNRSFVKHWPAQSIRPEEKAKHAGDPK